MRMRKPLLASAIGLCVAGTAVADPPIGSRLGNRVSGDPEKNERNAALGAHEMARCLVNKQRRTVQEFLATVDPQQSKHYADAMSGEHECFSMAEGNDLVEGRMVEFPPDIYRGMLAEWMIRSDERTFAALPALPRQLTYSRNWYAVSERDSSVDEMATCVSESDPQETLTLLKTLPYSNDEGAALGALGPTLGACLRAGVKVNANRQALRAALADALYQRIANPAPVPSADPAQQAAKAQ